MPSIWSEGGREKAERGRGGVRGSRNEAEEIDVCACTCTCS